MYRPQKSDETCSGYSENEVKKRSKEKLANEVKDVLL